MPVTNAFTVDWPSDRRSARRRFRPRRVFVVGLRSRRSRRKRQDNGDPGRRVRLPIQRCARWTTDEQGRCSDRRVEAPLRDERAQGGARGSNEACPRVGSWRKPRQAELARFQAVVRSGEKREAQRGLWTPDASGRGRGLEGVGPGVVGEAVGAGLLRGGASLSLVGGLR